jgi:hypothetical protein
MALYYGKHKVKDYDAWRPYFDADQPRLNGVGATAVSVMRSANDPNEVHFIFDVPDFAAFAGVMQSPELGEVMQKAGVIEQPSIYKLEEPGH